jgi:hypothetical protein
MDCSGCWYGNVSTNSAGAWLEQTAGRRQQYYGGQPSVSQVLPPTRSLDDEMATTTTDAHSVDDMSMAETTEHGVKRKNLFMAAPQEKRNKWQVGESYSVFGVSNTISPRDNVSHMQQKRACSFSGLETGSLAKRKYILDSKEQTVSNLICRRGERTTDGLHSSYTEIDPRKLNFELHKQPGNS